jgi:5'(3')-deoxyribonucleotidase
MTLKEKKELMDKLGKQAVIYFDMDGVLAKWEEGCTYERTLEPNYFFTLELEEAIKEAMLLLMEAGFEICILSAAYMNGVAEIDKARWLEKYGLDHVPRLFVPCGISKSEFIDAKPGVNYFLLDDYNFNLTNWSATEKNGGNFVAIKFLNGINGGSNIWKGRTLYHNSTGEILAHSLADFVVMV